MDEGGSESAGGEIEGESTAFDDSGEGFAAVLKKVFGDTLAIDLFDRSGRKTDEV